MFFFKKYLIHNKKNFKTKWGCLRVYVKKFNIKSGLKRRFESFNTFLLLLITEQLSIKKLMHVYEFKK